jgi:hypothetical protein
MLPTDTLRRNLGQSLLHPLLMCTTWCKHASKFTSCGLLGVAHVGNCRVLSATNMVYRKPPDGMLKDRAFMCGRPYTNLDYCCYCTWGYRKEQRYVYRKVVPRPGKLPKHGKRQTQNNGPTGSEPVQNGAIRDPLPLAFSTPQICVVILSYTVILYKSVRGWSGVRGKP